MFRNFTLAHVRSAGLADSTEILVNAPTSFSGPRRSAVGSFGSSGSGQVSDRRSAPADPRQSDDRHQVRLRYRSRDGCPPRRDQQPARAHQASGHSHPGGQVLLITEGTGYYQERGKPARIVHKGDVIKCAPGVEHWHGATPNDSFAYIAVTPTAKGKTIWLEPVSDKDYSSVK
jgi:mannose-6-phosphate isomerase-like protein (cupin superfamily)